MNDALTLAAELRQFTGSENFYRHPLVRKIIYTDGVKFLADKAGAYWLIDELAFAQEFEPSVKCEEFQFWKLAVEGDSTAKLSCENGNGKTVYSKDISLTDFPMKEIKLYCTDSTILFTSEY